MSIYLQNLQIDDLESPPYFIWKPSVMQGVYFAALLHHAQEGSGDDLNPAEHIVIVYVPLSKLSRIGKYLFLICVKDNHVDKDRSHRKLWALPLALSFEYKQVKLTDPPLVEQKPMLFRGKPKPCPVLVKGEVLPGEHWARPIIGLTVEKGYLDADNKWHPVEAERQVPDSELEDWNIWWDDQASAWRFRVVWKQQLSRTKFSPNQERYRLRAYALCNRSESATTADFRVMSMAKPVNAGITRGYSTSESPFPPIPIPLYPDSGGVVPLIVAGGVGGQHLAYDYGALAPAPVNSAEVGKVAKGEFTLASAIIPNRRVLEQINTTYLSLVSRYGSGRVRVLCGPLDGATRYNNDFNLGPHRILDHGVINLVLKSEEGSTPEEQYERDLIQTTYCHTEYYEGSSPEGMPADGTQVDISTPITRVSDFFGAQEPPMAREARQLSLGYVQMDPAYIAVQILSPRGWVEYQHWVTPVNLPSVTGQHLHFEVRRPSKAEGYDDRGVPQDSDGDGARRARGEYDPGDYLALNYGER